MGRFGEKSSKLRLDGRNLELGNLKDVWNEWLEGLGWLYCFLDAFLRDVLIHINMAME